MSSYSIPHGSTSNSNCSTCSKISYDREMQQLRGAAEVGYQGVVDKVSAFYTKNLAQSWKIMFKVFNHCLTTRTSGQDQTKINILQMFHAVINRTNVDYAALLWWDFMNNVNQKKEAIQYPRFIKLIIADLMKKFPDIPQRIEEDYHSIKDDIPLVSVYTTGNVLVRGMLIPDAFLTEEIRATDDFKEYETVFMNVDVPMNQPQPVVSTQGTHRSTPRAHRTPTLTASPQGKKEEAKTSEHITDDDDDEEIEKEKKDEEVEKEKEDVEIEKEKDITDDGTVFEELTAIISPTIATTSKDSSTTKCKKRYFSHKTKTLPDKVLDNCNKVIPEMTFAKTNEMIKEEMPRLVKLAVDKDREVSPVDISDIVSKEFAAHGPKMIEELF
ncbi:hypothetical protein Tco_1362269 [Tanacetum coccineum]